jgi:hypothetical protein
MHERVPFFCPCGFIDVHVEYFQENFVREPVDGHKSYITTMTVTPSAVVSSD